MATALQTVSSQIATIGLELTVGDRRKCTWMLSTRLQLEAEHRSGGTCPGWAMTNLRRRLCIWLAVKCISPSLTLVRSDTVPSACSVLGVNSLLSRTAQSHPLSSPEPPPEPPPEPLSESRLHCQNWKTMRVTFSTWTKLQVCVIL